MNELRYTSKYNAIRLTKPKIFNQFALLAEEILSIYV